MLARHLVEPLKTVRSVAAENVLIRIMEDARLFSSNDLRSELPLPKLRWHNPVTMSPDVSRSVARIHDQPSVLDDPGPVVVGMVGHDHHTVLGGEQHFG